MGLKTKKENRKSKKENRKKFLGFFIIIVILFFFMKNRITIVSNFIDSIFIPIQGKIYLANEKILKIKNVVYNYKKTLDDNENYRQKNLLLETKLANISNLEEENQRLKNLLEIKKSNSNIKIGTVIYKNILELYKEFDINLGKEDGINSNMYAVVGDKLIGKIKQLNENNATVEMVTSGDIYISGMTNNKVLGIVKGDDSDSEKLIFIPSIYKKNVEIGDIIYTSGISDIYPQGLILGKIIGEIKEGEFSIDPEINILTLKEVVIKSRDVN